MLKGNVLKEEINSIKKVFVDKYFNDYGYKYCYSQCIKQMKENKLPSIAFVGYWFVILFD